MFLLLKVWLKILEKRHINSYSERMRGFSGVQDFYKKLISWILVHYSATPVWGLSACKQCGLLVIGPFCFSIVMFAV